MNVVAPIRSVALDTARPLSIAVLAMGGQGGGVLVDWIVALAESQGWAGAIDLGARASPSAPARPSTMIEAMPLPRRARTSARCSR